MNNWGERNFHCRRCGESLTVGEYHNGQKHCNQCLKYFEMIRTELLINHQSYARQPKELKEGNKRFNIT
jgi:hypothetical protein